jgi:sigma-B regulation protein RsbU (phosphoserine phosphatase)
MFRLRVTPAQGEPFDHVLVESSLVVGRSSASDLVLADPFLSRCHTRFYLDGETLFVEDLGSRNGTRVNGNPVTGPAAVKAGDVVKLSNSSIAVALEADAETEAERPLAELGMHTVIRNASDLVRDASTTDATRLEGEEALRRYASRLKLLNEVHQALARSSALGELLDLILDRVFDHLGPEQGAIFLRRPDGEIARVAGRSLAGPEADYLFSRSLVREVTEKQIAALVLDARTDRRFAESESVRLFGIQSLLAAPLLDPEGALGMIVLTSRLQARQFTEEDLELLVSLAAVAALRIRNVALAEEAAERRRLEEELALARRIQVTALPQALPEVPGYELHAGNLPSRRVSGDYYEVLTRRDGEECVLMIADVSGKGLAAALLVATLEALSASPIQAGRPPEEICGILARLLFDRTPPEKYATAFLAVLEPAAGRLRYANAGHNPGLLLRRSGAVEQLAATGPPLGLLPGAQYGAAEVTLAAGDLLLLYTDGITEAANPEGEELSLPRLIEACQRHRGEALRELALRIERELDRFVLGVPFDDDRTFVMVRRLAAEG